MTKENKPPNNLSHPEKAPITFAFDLQKRKTEQLIKEIRQILVNPNATAAREKETKKLLKPR